MLRCDELRLPRLVAGGLVSGACSKSADANAAQYAQVTNVEPIAWINSTPRQSCNNVTVQYQGDPELKHEIIATAPGQSPVGLPATSVSARRSATSTYECSRV